MESGHSVCHASADFETTMALCEVFLGDDWYEHEEQVAGKYFDSDGE